MPIHHSLWRVGSTPQALIEAVLPSEALLESMIVAAPEILSREWMIIGRQEDTGFGGRIDLLALAPDGALILIELKRGKTPREVLAQAINYASWAELLRRRKSRASTAVIPGASRWMKRSPLVSASRSIRIP